MLRQLLFFFIPVSFHASGCDLEAERKNLFLWSVEDPSRKIKAYLFGTIHVPYTDVWDRVSDRVKEAFNRADTVAVEVDLHDQDKLDNLIQCKFLKRRQTALTYLSPQVYYRIEKYMSQLRNRMIMWATAYNRKSEEEASSAVSIAMGTFSSIVGGWERKRPEWLLITLFQLSENYLDKTSDPMLDIFLASSAKKNDKNVLSIESVDEQCNPVSTVQQRDVVFAINYTLSRLEENFSLDRWPNVRKDKTVEDMVRSYRCGDIDEATLDGASIMKVLGHATESETERERKIEERLRNDIIRVRNSRIARRLDGILNDFRGKKVFAAVGTGHFFGMNNVLEHLSAMGYNINAVNETDEIKYPAAVRDPRFKALWIREHQDLQNMEVVLEFSELNRSSLTPVLSSSLCIALVFLLYR